MVKITLETAKIKASNNFEMITTLRKYVSDVRYIIEYLQNDGEKFNGKKFSARFTNAINDLDTYVKLKASKDGYVSLYMWDNGTRKTMEDIFEYNGLYNYLGERKETSVYNVDTKKMTDKVYLINEDDKLIVDSWVKLFQGSVDLMIHRIQERIEFIDPIVVLDCFHREYEMEQKIKALQDEQRKIRPHFLRD